MTKSEQLRDILDRGGIPCREVHVIGNAAHIDAYKKHRIALADLMGQAGWQLTYEKDGEHMVGPPGLRLVFRLT